MRKLAVLPNLSSAQGKNLSEYTAAVIDVLRATSSITWAFSSGCRALIPAVTTEQARDILSKNPGALITGERGGLRVEGFDLGNSPREYTPEKVRGKLIVMTTSNGTKAILGAASLGAHPVHICSFLNLTAVARACLSQSRNIAVVCAGNQGETSLEDFACAGALVSLVLTLAAPGTCEVDIDARDAISCFEKYDSDPLRLLQSVPHGKNLVDLGFGDDLAFCADVDAVDSVPIYCQGAVTLRPGR